MRLACISMRAKGHPAYWRRGHGRQRTGYCSRSNRSKSLMRKRDIRKLEEEHSGQVTGIHRLPLREAIIYPARARATLACLQGVFGVGRAFAAEGQAISPAVHVEESRRRFLNR